MHSCRSLARAPVVFPSFARYLPRSLFCLPFLASVLPARTVYAVKQLPLGTHARTHAILLRSAWLGSAWLGRSWLSLAWLGSILAELGWAWFGAVELALPWLGNTPAVLVFVFVFVLSRAVVVVLVVVVARCGAVRCGTMRCVVARCGAVRCVGLCCTFFSRLCYPHDRLCNDGRMSIRTLVARSAFTGEHARNITCAHFSYLFRF